MNFIDELNKTLDSEYNISVTENGAVGYKTTNHQILDMNFKVASYRHMSEDEIISDFIKAYNENPVVAIKWLFYARDVRSGLGERRLFRVAFKYIANLKPIVAERLLSLIAEYGRYDDLIDLLGTSVDGAVIRLLKSTIKQDLINCRDGKSVSLLAKWMPSVNTSSEKSRATARRLAKSFGMTERQYRKTLSLLRSRIDIVEKKMSSNHWEDIDYEAVPSKANLLYNKAFFAHDEDRRKKFLDSVNNGEAHINSSVTFPHEIVHKYVSDSDRFGWHMRVTHTDSGLEALWKALPNYTTEQTITVADGSGSMFTQVDSKSKVTAIEVANALAVYTAERCSGEFKNKYITFSERPQLVSLNGETLADNLNIAGRYNECANTNIEAVFNLILNTAVNANMKQSDMPKNILIISDMEFDCCATCNSNRRGINSTLFNKIAERYKSHGYKIPRLIFWNVNSRTCTIPVKENDMGVALVSGFSVNILQMVLGDNLDPYELLLNILNSKRYQAIEDALKG